MWRTDFADNKGGRFGVTAVPDGGWTYCDEHRPFDRNMKSVTSPRASGPRKRTPTTKFEENGELRDRSKTAMRRMASPKPGDTERRSELRPSAQHEVEVATLSAAPPRTDALADFQHFVHNMVGGWVGGGGGGWDEVNPNPNPIPIPNLNPNLPPQPQPPTPTPG